MASPQAGIAYGTLAYLVVLVGMLLSTFFLCGKDKRQARLLVTIAVFMMWMLWVCVYMMQMYPLINPQRE